MMKRFIANLILAIKETMKETEQQKSDNIKTIKQNAIENDRHAQYELGCMYLYGNGVIEDEKKAVYWLKKSAKDNQPDALYMLYLIYMYGLIDIKRDLKKAFFYFMRSSSWGHPVASKRNSGIASVGRDIMFDGTIDFQVGYGFMQGAKGFRQDFGKALKYFTVAAGRGHAKAQYYLGFMYECGYGTKRDEKKSVHWYKKCLDRKYSDERNYKPFHCADKTIDECRQAAQNCLLELKAQQGDAQAQYDLEKFYSDRYYGYSDKSIDWYEKAAEQGHIKAQYHLALQYRRRNDKKTDIKKAIHWLTQLAEQGYAEAQYELGDAYPYRDKKKALYWWTQSAEQGYAEAQKALSEKYRNGYGVEKNPEKYIYWLTQLAENKDYQKQYKLTKKFKFEEWQTHGLIVDANRSLAKIYEKGEGVKQDPKKAFYWYTKCAEQGVPHAQYKLSVMYKAGYGVEKDEKQAIRWLIKSANNGNESASRHLGHMYRDGDRVNYKKAIYWYTKATKQGDLGAIYYLGFMYDSGHGVEQDFKKALYYWKKASKKGYKKATEKLEQLGIQ